MSLFICFVCCFCAYLKKRRDDGVQTPILVDAGLGPSHVLPKKGPSMHAIVEDAETPGEDMGAGGGKRALGGKGRSAQRGSLQFPSIAESGSACSGATPRVSILRGSSAQRGSLIPGDAGQARPSECGQWTLTGVTAPGKRLSTSHRPSASAAAATPLRVHPSHARVR